MLNLRTKVKLERRHQASPNTREGGRRDEGEDRKKICKQVKEETTKNKGVGKLGQCLLPIWRLRQEDDLNPGGHAVVNVT